MKCPLCSGISVFYHHFLQNSHSFKVQRCKNCQSLFQEDIDDNINALYSKAYYHKEQEYSYQDERIIAKAASAVWRARVKNIRKYIQIGKFLDVGCAFGGFLREVSKYFQAVGLDVSNYAVQEGKKWCSNKNIYGIFQGDLLNLPHDKIFYHKNFNVISMIEVAEHLSKPRENFKVAFELLSPGGMLIIQTANFEGWQAKKAGFNYHYFLPGHLMYYTASGLKQSLKNIGFKYFYEFIPVDFGILPKLIKSRASFQNYKDYLSWLYIISYHFISKLYFKGYPLTSSYVLYAFK